MEAGKQVFYLRQELRRSLSFTALAGPLTETRVIAHFYVQADDATSAGGAAGTFQLAQGLELVEYICLPQPISRSKLPGEEPEHIEAFELAQAQGFGCRFGRVDLAVA